jgi:NADH:ubiquinone oxidoreductase subunit H
VSPEVVAALAKTGLWVFALLQVAPVMLWLERRAPAFMQDRLGPNRVGPLGLFQGMADAVKFIFKEDVTPAGADKPLFLMAPMLALLPAMTTFVVLPFGPEVTIAGHTTRRWSSPDAGVLLFLALASLGVYSLVLAGYGSNNKFSLIGSIRASAQMVSYELALTLPRSCRVLIPGLVEPPTWSPTSARGSGRSSPAPRLPRLPGRRLRRDQPPPLRPPRGRVRARRRLPHRVQRDALRHASSWASTCR